jgi:hypothetical protein
MIEVALQTAWAWIVGKCAGGPEDPWATGIITGVFAITALCGWIMRETRKERKSEKRIGSPSRFEPREKRFPEASLPPVRNIAKPPKMVRPGSNDEKKPVLFLEHPGALSAKAYEGLARSLREVFPNMKTVILEEGMKAAAVMGDEKDIPAIRRISAEKEAPNIDDSRPLFKHASVPAFVNTGLGMDIITDPTFQQQIRDILADPSRNISPDEAQKRLKEGFRSAVDGAIITAKAFSDTPQALKDAGWPVGKAVEAARPELGKAAKEAKKMKAPIVWGNGELGQIEWEIDE